MKRQKLLVSIVAIAILLLGLTAGLATAQAPDADPAGATAVALGTAFTYQGQLIKDGVPANGSCDIRFILYDAGVGGNQVGPIVEKLAVVVTGGLFTVPDLDFGGGVFVGDKRWLEVAVKCPAGSGSYATVGNRQELTATPYALYATKNWGLGGNAGTTPGTNYLGTSDDQALELKVNGQRALRIEPNATSPNLISGYSGNAVDAGIYGATIGGGGTSGSSCGPNIDQPCWNRVRGDYNVIGGGIGNTASGYWATVGGGGDNTASGDLATVGGGGDNTAGGDFYATVGGGYSNTASGDWATVGGGHSNTASGYLSTVGGGQGNTTTVGGATVGGGGDNTASGYWATVGGGQGNTASGNWATVGGGQGNTASAGEATVGGGDHNTASGNLATVGGGGDNTASGHWATVGGGRFNTASGDYSFAAGHQAKANTQGSFIWADSTAVDFVSAASNEFAARAGGGVRLVVGSGALRIEPNATSPNMIGGSSSNAVDAGKVGTTIGGGGVSGSACGWTIDQPCWNRVLGSFGTVGGGSANTASDDATVGGGHFNTASNGGATVGGGYFNTASNGGATVGGGYSNTASGNWATVGGGFDNTASGDYSFAAGRRAKAATHGSFVWGDSTDDDITSTADNQFVVRAYGGVKLVRGASSVASSFSALQVEQTKSSGEGIWARSSNAGNPHAVSSSSSPAPAATSPKAPTTRARKSSTSTTAVPSSPGRTLPNRCRPRGAKRPMRPAMCWYSAQLSRAPWRSVRSLTTAR